MGDSALYVLNAGINANNTPDGLSRPTADKWRRVGLLNLGVLGTDAPSDRG